MLDLARRRCAENPNVTFHRGTATEVPLPDAEFDAAVCVQVLEYVADADAALAELRRILRPGGRVLVWDIDWATLSVSSEQADLTARVLRAWDEHLAHRTLPRTLAPRLRAAGFDEVRAQPHPMFAAEYDEGRRHLAALVPFIATFVTGRQGLTEAEAQAWVDEQRRGDFYAVVTQVCFTASRP
jgi:ubiquinone/menaquinone biosynthesis C-methylase UbiE